MVIKHKFVSDVTDAGDPDEVGPDEWNDDHEIDILTTDGDLLYRAPTTNYATSGNGASATFNGNVGTGANIIDGDDTTYAGTYNFQTPTATIDLGQARNIKEIRLLISTAGQTNISVEYSSDNTNWTTEASSPYAIGGGGETLITLPAAISRRYWRFAGATDGTTRSYYSIELRAQPQVTRLPSTVLGQSILNGASAAAVQALIDPTIPSGGTLYPGLSTSGWTSFQSPTTFDADTTVPGHFYMAKTSMGTGEMVGARRSTSSLPRTYTMKISDWWDLTNFQGAGLFVGEASPGKYFLVSTIRDGANSYLQRAVWTNATTQGTNTNMPSTNDFGFRAPLWLRLVVNSSTSIDVYVSRNGLLYFPLVTGVNPGFTVGTFGFAMVAFAAIEMRMAIDWIHES